MMPDRSRRAADARMGQHLALGSAIGAAVGAAIGVTAGDMGFWTAIGIPLGVACGFATSGGGRPERTMQPIHPLHSSHEDNASR